MSRKKIPHTCNGCGRTEEEVKFNNRTVKGRTYLRHLCSECDSKRSSQYPNKPESKARKNDVQKRKMTLERQDNAKAPKYIVKDSRSSDGKKGFENNLTEEFVRSILVKGCCYCGETEGRLTLDRIDNTLGHLQSNVVPACIRCNYVRGNMPHVAWLVVAEGMRKAKALGLFGNWYGRAPKKITQSAV